MSLAMALFTVEMRRLGKNIPPRENMYEVEDAFKALEKIGAENEQRK